ncbi:hypothetical protein [Spinactinospora alkalitolerans]
MVTAKGAPGATTSTLAMSMTWPRPVLMIEADPAGGDLQSGFLQGVDVGQRNLLQLARTVRHGITAVDIARQCLSLDPPETTHLVLPGLPSPFQGASLAPMWDPLLEAASQFWVRNPIWSTPVDVVVDCGRLDHPHMPWRLVEAADLVVLVFRSTLTSITVAKPWADHVRGRLEQADGRPDALAGLVITEGSYSAAEIRRTGIDVVATLPHDPAAARVLTERTHVPRGFHRSQFVRSARSAAEALRARGPEPAEEERDAAARRAEAVGPHEEEEQEVAHVGL